MPLLGIFSPGTSSILIQVLASKETQASELRKKLGIGFGQQIQQKFATIADSDT